MKYMKLCRKIKKDQSILEKHQRLCKITSNSAVVVNLRLVDSFLPQVYNIDDGGLLYSTQTTNDVLTCVDAPTTADVISTGTQRGSAWVWSVVDGSSLAHIVPDGTEDIGRVMVMKFFSSKNCAGLVYATESGYVVGFS